MGKIKFVAINNLEYLFLYYNKQRFVIDWLYLRCYWYLKFNELF